MNISHWNEKLRQSDITKFWFRSIIDNTFLSFQEKWILTNIEKSHQFHQVKKRRKKTRKRRLLTKEADEILIEETSNFFKSIKWQFLTKNKHIKYRTLSVTKRRKCHEQMNFGTSTEKAMTNTPIALNCEMNFCGQLHSQLFSHLRTTTGEVSIEFEWKKRSYH